MLQRRNLAARMDVIARQVPELRRRAAALPVERAPPGVELAGQTDAIAGATLQGLVQALAGREGVTPATMETLPSVAAGPYRRVGLRVSLVAPYAVFVKLLHALVQATPPLLIDDLDIEAARLINQPVDRPLEVTFSVFGFRREPVP